MGSCRTSTSSAAQRDTRVLLEGRRTRAQVGLSTRLLDYDRHVREALGQGTDFSRIWVDTLELLFELGVGDQIAFVDIVHEFPFFCTAAYPRLFATPPDDYSVFGAPWPASRREAVREFMTSALATLRARYPDLRFTVSYTAFGKSDLFEADTSQFDLAELHLWLTDIDEFDATTRHSAAALHRRAAVTEHARLANELYFGSQRWNEVLAAHVDAAAAWAADRQLPLWTIEGWASVYFHDSPGDVWRYIRECGATAVELALERGWEGICTSNFTGPQLTRLWADAGWHRELTAAIPGRSR